MAGKSEKAYVERKLDKVAVRNTFVIAEKMLKRTTFIEERNALMAFSRDAWEIRVYLAERGEFVLLTKNAHFAAVRRQVKEQENALCSSCRECKVEIQENSESSEGAFH